MRQLNIEEIKLIQLEILKDIHSYCTANHLLYSLAYGSLLGAVRHKGYIPWDDDIDIMMPRDDYDRFVSSYESNRFKIAEREKDKSYYISFANVHDPNTRLIEQTDLPQSEFGVYVDVFPLDNIPDNESDLKRLMMKKRILNYIYTLKVVKIRRRSSVWKNLVLAVSKLLLNPLSFDWIVNNMIKICKSYKGIQTKRVGLIAPSDSTRREIWASSIFNDYVLLPFEDGEFSCVADYDSVLRSMYGDYMQLPPEEKRVSHHMCEAYIL